MESNWVVAGRRKSPGRPNMARTHQMASFPSISMGPMAINRGQEGVLRRNVARIHGRFGQGRQGEISDWRDGKTDKGGLELTSHEQMASRRQKR